MVKYLGACGIHSKLNLSFTTQFISKLFCHFSLHGTVNVSDIDIFAIMLGYLGIGCCPLYVCLSCCSIPNLHEIPFATEECIQNFQFLTQTTIYGEDGEYVKSKQRVTSKLCIAIVYNPLLGIQFSHRAVDCEKQYNIICQRGGSSSSLSTINLS